MTVTVLYSIAGFALLVSFLKDKKKTKMSLKKAWGSFRKILPAIISIMLLVGISLALINPQTISKLIGAESGILGIVIALTAGSISLIPPFVSFPLAAALLDGGAGYPQIAAFVATLSGVGLLTLPVEIQYFNKNLALLRNGTAFVIAVLFTIIIGMVM